MIAYVVDEALAMRVAVEDRLAAEAKPRELAPGLRWADESDYDDPLDEAVKDAA